MDSNSKKIIEKLVKIAEKQQAIINKLAQSTFNPTGAEPPPGEIKPAVSQKTPAKMLIESLPGMLGKVFSNIEAHGDKMHVLFLQGQKTQGNYNKILAKLQELTNQNQINGSYTLVASDAR